MPRSFGWTLLSLIALSLSLLGISHFLLSGGAPPIENNSPTNSSLADPTSPPPPTLPLKLSLLDEKTLQLSLGEAAPETIIGLTLELSWPAPPDTGTTPVPISLEGIPTSPLPTTQAEVKLHPEKLPFQLAPPFAPGGEWQNPINTLRCDEESCLAQLALLNLGQAPTLFPSELARLQLTAPLTNGLEHVTIKRAHSLFITNQNQVVYLE